MSDTSVLLGGRAAAPARLTRTRRRAQTGAVSAVAFAGLGLMHFAVRRSDQCPGSSSARVGGAHRGSARLARGGRCPRPSTASLVQPLTARLVRRFGERGVAAAGALFAAVGYGSVPAVGSGTQAVVAVVVGGVGSALFHPAAGALIAQAAGAGRESLQLAAFSAVGAAGAAVVSFGVLVSVDSLGWAAAAPAAAAAPGRHGRPQGRGVPAGRAGHRLPPTTAAQAAVRFASRSLRGR